MPKYADELSYQGESVKGEAMKFHKQTVFRVTLLISLCLITSTSCKLAPRDTSIILPYLQLQEEGLWDSLEYDKRLAALQLPDWFMTQASTSELFDIVLMNPSLSHLYTFDDPKTAYYNLCRDYNGFKEIVKRKDFPQVLIDRYLTTPIVADISSVDNNISYGSLLLIEALLCLPDIHARFSEADLQFLLEHALVNKAQKQLAPALHSPDIFVELLRRMP